MTTILAIRGKDGIVMCADTRETGKTWEQVMKLTPIGRNAILGCAGKAEYISLLTRFIRGEFGKPADRNYFDIIHDATNSYSKTINQNNKESGLAPSDDYYPQGILALYDSKDNQHIIFKIQPPGPPIQVDYPHRATAGTGGLPADIFLKNVEFLLDKVGYKWENLSTSLIAKFCFVLMFRVAYLEPYTSGLQAYRLNESDMEELSQEKVFGHIQIGERSLGILIASAIDEIGVGRIKPVAEQYRFSSLVKKLGYS